MSERDAKLESMTEKIQPAKKSKSFKFGLGLIILSLVLWVSPLCIPFTPLSVSEKISATVALLIAAEILFWVGAVFVGKQYAQNIKNWFNPTKWKKN